MQDTSNNTPQETRSDFALMLTRLFESGIHTRGGWLEILGVHRQTMYQWLSDQTIPRPPLLRLIVDHVTRKKTELEVPLDTMTSRGAGMSTSDASDVSQLRTLLESFWQMAGKPSVTVSPKHGKRMGATVAHYMVPAALTALSKELGTVSSPRAQLAIIERAIDECRREAARPTVDSPERREPPESDALRFHRALEQIASADDYPLKATLLTGNFEGLRDVDQRREVVVRAYELLLKDRPQTQTPTLVDLAESSWSEVEKFDAVQEAARQLSLTGATPH